MNKQIRVWMNLDITAVQKQLLFIDDLYGVCGSCKQTGLKYTEHRQCPNCKAQFRYAATSSNSPAVIAQMLARIQKDHIPLQLIDRADYEQAVAKNAANQLFAD
ncbi:MAG: hypothetical protein KDK39_07955 [Leptospiraceae bacterium]|nr:hypothetical protein [Leptospiraceae bacterium]